MLRGAATMAGCKSGVATRINADEPRAIFTHCYGHSLNPACCDAIKKSKPMQDALDTTHEMTKSEVSLETSIYRFDPDYEFN